MGTEGVDVDYALAASRERIGRVRSCYNLRRYAMKLTTAVFFSVVIVLAASSPATSQTDASKLESRKFPPTGSTWISRVTTTGSFGSATGEFKLEALGDVDWEGRRVFGFYGGGVHSYYDSFDAQRRLLAVVRDGKPLETFDPYEAVYDWPLSVGKSWVSAFRTKYHHRNETVDFKLDFRVEAFEEITTPAGALRTFRVLRSSPNGRFVVWFAPELGIEVKHDWERFSTHPIGPGTRQMELLSYTIKK
jgi:hypothetical protein